MTRSISNAKIKAITGRVAMLVSAVILFGVVIWIGQRLFRPVEVPPMASMAAPIVFDKNADIRTNPMFQELQMFVSGQPVIASIGNPFPFVGSRLKAGDATGSQVIQLATLNEIPLDGFFIADIIRGSDGQVLALAYRASEGGAIRYEIRRYDASGVFTPFAAWESPSGASEERAYGITQGLDGIVWLVSDTGRVGTVERDGSPNWAYQAFDGKSQMPVRILTDGLSRAWVTDGMELYVKEKTSASFVRVDLPSLLDENERPGFLRALQNLPAGFKPTETDESEMLRVALRPTGLFPVRDGSIAVTTKYGVFSFVATLSNPAWSQSLSASVFPIAVMNNGEEWGRRYTDDALIRKTASGDVSFPSKTAAPLQARERPELFVSMNDLVYALDYVLPSPYLWVLAEGGWANRIVVPAIRLTDGTPARIEMDAQGSVWIKMQDGRLLRITEGTKT